jgi:hypothetical protein
LLHFAASSSAPSKVASYAAGAIDYNYQRISIFSDSKVVALSLKAVKVARAVE